METEYCGNNMTHPAHYWGKTTTNPRLSIIKECEGVIEIPIVDKQCMVFLPHRGHMFVEGGKHYSCGGVREKEKTPEERLPQKAVDAFKEAWEAERKKIGRGIAEPGTKTRAGLVAALDVLYELGDIE